MKEEEFRGERLFKKKKIMTIYLQVCVSIWLRLNTKFWYWVPYRNHTVPWYRTHNLGKFCIITRTDLKETWIFFNLLRMRKSDETRLMSRIKDIEGYKLPSFLTWQCIPENPAGHEQEYPSYIKSSFSLNSLMINSLNLQWHLCTSFSKMPLRPIKKCSTSYLNYSTSCPTTQTIS